MNPGITTAGSEAVATVASAEVSVTNVAGTDATATDKFVFNQDLAKGDSVTIAGLKITATDALTKADAATAFATLLNGKADAASITAGTGTGYSYDAATLDMKGWADIAWTADAGTLTVTAVGTTGIQDLDATFEAAPAA